MRTWRFPMVATAALAVSAIIAAAIERVAGADFDATGDGPPLRLLATPAELDATSLSIVDEKLALSLAVEIHVQIELTEFALAGIQHDALKQLTLRKLALYHRLLDTLDNLSGGRAMATLSRSARPRNPVHQSTTADAEPSDSQASGPDKAADSEPQSATARADAERAPRRPARRGGGISNIIQNAATTAILRVRLEIAEQYGGLLRAELAATPPAEFDRYYLAIEVFNQMQIMAMLRVFEHQASPDFGRILHVATATAEAQLVDARHVFEILKTAPQPATVVPVPRAPAPLAPVPLVHSVDTSGS